VTTPPRCSLTSLATRERLAGSAAVATAWLLVEQPLRWQRDAADSPHPDHPYAMTRLVTRAGEFDVRLQLLRRPAEKGAAKAGPEPWVPLVVLATTDAAGGRAAQARLRPEELDGLADGGTLDALVRGELPGTWEPVERLWAVCTHGRRDVCCAIEGRRLTAMLLEAEPGLVWETTHTGGHRFAPNAVVLPDGLVYGRVVPERVDELVTAQREGRVVNDLLRGRAALPAATQVAEVALREHLHAYGKEDVLLVASGPAEVESAEPTGTRTPSRWRAGGREWRVLVDAAPASPRPVSCGAEATRPVEHTVVELTDVDAAGRGAAGWDARHLGAPRPRPDDADPRVMTAVEHVWRTGGGR
jgi:(2Fe-2S) ferredoxin